MRLRLLLNRFVLLPGCTLAFQACGSAQATPKPPVQLQGDRFRPLTYDEMNEAQKALTDRALSGKLEGGTSGAFNVLLRSPEMSERLKEFGTSALSQSSLGPKLNELAILITTRAWTAQYPWANHHRAAIRAGLNADVIDAIAAGKRPATLQPDEEAVYNLCTELLTNGQVSDATFQAAKDRIGERGIVDVIGVVGYYQIVSMLLNVDRYPLPDASKRELRPIR